MTKEKRTNNDLQNIMQKTKDRASRTALKIGDELRYWGRVSSSCSTSGTRHATLVTNPVITIFARLSILQIQIIDRYI
jgi:hypothetical protein